MNVRVVEPSRVWVLGAFLGAIAASLGLVACAGGGGGPIEPGPDANRRIQAALIEVEPGAVVELAAGRFDLDTSLSLDVAGVTVRGQGMGETILDFADQAPGSGGEGITVTADDFVVEDLTVANTRGDGIKVEGTRGATFRRVMVDWEGPPKTTNGAYGLYPVQVTDVLIEDSKVRGSSDAGIYVGQSRNIIVRRNEVWENVAGIEIENSTGADVHANEAHHNAGGILVFSLPELPVKDGRDSRVWDNEIYQNNHPNFGKPGAIVSALPPGSGLILMANDNTEVWDNTFRDNQTAHVSVISFLATQREYDDPGYDPYPEGIWIHDNRFEGGGEDPQGDFAAAVMPHLGGRMPDIVWDGMVDPAKLVDGEVRPENRLYLGDNGDAEFAAVDFAALAAGRAPNIVRDASAFAGVLPSPPPPVTLEAGERGASTAATAGG
ncbi:MAG TPA: parallel beta-helix domain-containing protein [Thermoanaerobaculia bacterium]|nr:parallel beta-helix domain-containing protein [Thermoanaerobaculia bacterium]